MTNIIKFKSSDVEHFSKACQIRQLVFVEEQQVDAKDEFDEFEDESTHYLIYSGQIEVATARWRATSKGIKLERFAVLKAYRGQGFGEEVLKAVLQDVLPLNQTIYLHAQVSALDFYKKNHFESVGDMFLECNIEHYLMEHNSKI